MQNEEARGFERWLKRRAERATSPSTSDREYADYVASVSGEQAQRDAGRARHLQPGGPDRTEGLGDDVVYASYLQELDGTASRRRAEESARQEARDREQEVIRHAGLVGGGLSRSHEHLRSRLQGFGRPNEGSD